MKKYLIIVLSIILCFICFPFCQNQKAYADELSDTIREEINNLDLIDLEEYFNNLNLLSSNDFFGYLNELLEGKYSLNYNDFSSYIFNLFFNGVYNLLPVFISIVAIAIFCGIINNVKGSFVSTNISLIIYFVCILSIILLLMGQIISIYNITKTTIEKLSNLTEIMSPIIITLMIASGGKVSASVYKPAVAFLSNGIIGLCSKILIPIVGVMLIFSLLSNFSSAIKLKKYSDFCASILKWLLGISITVFGIFMTIQGFTSATFDGISIRATKYAISNSIPIVGGFIKDGFDLIVAGNVLIKNTVGILVVFALIFTILSPVFQILSFSIMLKLVSGITEPIADGKISDFCTSISKCVTYFLSIILMAGFMLFITVLLMIFSANAFI